MSIKEIRNVLDILQLDYKKTNVVDKEGLLELLDVVGRNEYLDKVLNDIVSTRRDKHDKKEEEKNKKEQEEKERKNEKQKQMRQKLDDILSGKIQKFGFNEVREILQYMSNVDKIDLIKRMKPTVGNLLNIDVSSMDKTDLLSLIHTLGITIPKGAIEQKDLVVSINHELNRVGSNKKIDDLFVDVLHELVKERDRAYEEENKKHKEAMKKYEEEKKKYEEDMKKYEAAIKKQQQEQKLS